MSRRLFWLLCGSVFMASACSDGGPPAVSGPDLLTVSDPVIGAQPLATEYWFSTEISFFSTALGRLVSHGDLLSSNGSVVATNAELLAPFQPLVSTDVGLDAVHVRETEGDILFSTEVGFVSLALGGTFVSDGDVLSSNGTIVYRNADLLGPREGESGVDAMTDDGTRFSTEEPGELHGDMMTMPGGVNIENEYMLKEFNDGAALPDNVGLDAWINRGPFALEFYTDRLLTSTETDFFSVSLGQTVSHGDLLAHDGTIAATNAQLLSAFGVGLDGMGLDAASLPPGTTPEVLPVDIDIKPGSDPNSINSQSRGTIPVAVLSAEDFDAPSAVDRTTLTFGRTGDELSLQLRGSAEVPNCGAEDVNADGLPDLVCHFRTPATGFEAGDVEGILKGQTVGGVAIEGRDAVRIVR